MRHRKHITVPFFRVGQRKPTSDELRRLTGFMPRFGPPAA